jgi:hypothetical protein
MEQKYHPLIENVRKIKRIKEFLNDMGLLGKKYLKENQLTLLLWKGIMFIFQCSVSFVIDMTTRSKTERE